MDDHDHVLARVTAILVEVCGADPSAVDPDTRFEALGLDSVHMIDLVVAAEDEFGVRVSDEEIDELTTVGDAVTLIRRAPASG